MTPTTMQGHYYDTLWVKWQGKVAYCKALWAVSKEDFDSMGPEICTIKLGRMKTFRENLEGLLDATRCIIRESGPIFTSPSLNDEP